jgi:hypothetical protein
MPERIWIGAWRVAIKAAMRAQARGIRVKMEPVNGTRKLAPNTSSATLDVATEISGCGSEQRMLGTKQRNINLTLLRTPTKRNSGSHPATSYWRHFAQSLCQRLREPNVTYCINDFYFPDCE